MYSSAQKSVVWMGESQFEIFAHFLARPRNHWEIVGENRFAHNAQISSSESSEWAKVRPIFSPTIHERNHMDMARNGQWAKWAKTTFLPAPGGGRKKRESFRTLFSTTRSPLARRDASRKDTSRQSAHGSTQSARAERSLERVERAPDPHARTPPHAPLTHAHEVWR